MKYKYVFKFIVIGEVAVGKTSFIHQFVTERFNESYTATLGIDIANKIIDINNEKVNLIVWDTAGSEAFRSLTRSYYRAVAGIFLLFDITNPQSFEKVKFWLEECRANSNKTASIILVGNKCDLQAERKVTRAEALLFAEKNNLEYIEASSKSHDLVLKAFLKMATSIYQKIRDGSINVNDNESGARLSEEYLKEGAGKQEATLNAGNLCGIDKSNTKKCC